MLRFGPYAGTHKNFQWKSAFKGVYNAMALLYFCLILEVGVYSLYFLILFGLFSNQLIFESLPIFEEIP